MLVVAILNDTTLSMADSDRGFLLEIDLNKGVVNFSLNDPSYDNIDFFYFIVLKAHFKR